MSPLWSLQRYGQCFLGGVCHSARRRGMDNVILAEFAEAWVVSFVWSVQRHGQCLSCGACRGMCSVFCMECAEACEMSFLRSLQRHEQCLLYGVCRGMCNVILAESTETWLRIYLADGAVARQAARRIAHIRIRMRSSASLRS